MVVTTTDLQLSCNEDSAPALRRLLLHAGQQSPREPLDELPDGAEHRLLIAREDPVIGAVELD